MAHDAFISYSHGTDGKLAPALEGGLEKLGKRWLQLRAIDVFRDETGLAASARLWTGSVEHLAASSWSVFLASPESAESSWCQKEVQWWLDNRDGTRLLVVLTSGEIVWDERRNDFDWERATALPRLLEGPWSRSRSTSSASTWVAPFTSRSQVRMHQTMRARSINSTR